MNARITELWEEAAKTTQGDSWQEQTKFMEKYTELIVKECLGLVQKYMSRFPEDHELTKQIKEHFGVVK